MAGAAAVVGAIQALALRQAPVEAVGVAALVENMASDTSYRPGDIVKSMSGETVEIINTDAEGRLILLDALYYTTQRFKPRAIIHLATLNYAVGAALGLPPRRPRVLAVVLRDSNRALGPIQAALSGRLASLGAYRPERRPFLPHVTVARVRPGAPRISVGDLPEPPALSLTGNGQSNQKTVTMPAVHFNWIEFGGQTATFAMDEMRVADSFADLSAGASGTGCDEIFADGFE